jgi:hypothetical protein
MMPKDASPDQLFWCIEPDDSNTLRDFRTIEEDLQPGKWKVDPRYGNAYFVRDKLEKKKWSCWSLLRRLVFFTGMWFLFRGWETMKDEEGWWEETETHLLLRKVAGRKMRGFEVCSFFS